MVLFTEFLDTAQNTEQEANFFEQLATVKEHLMPVANLPMVGKLIKALIAMDDMGSFEAFKESEHYKNVQGYDIVIDPNKGYFSIIPGAAQRKKILMVLGGAVLAILLIVLCIKKCRR